VHCRRQVPAGARQRHRVRDPVVAAGIVDQRGLEVGAGRQVIASQDVDLPTWPRHGRGEVARGRQGRYRGPGVAAGVVGFHRAQGLPTVVATDSVDAPVPAARRGQEAPRRGQRRQGAPGIGGGGVGFHRSQVAPAGVVAAHHVETAIVAEGCREPLARGGQGRQAVCGAAGGCIVAGTGPGVAAGVVGFHRLKRAADVRAADDVDAAISARDHDEAMARGGQGRQAVRAAAGCRIVAGAGPGVAAGVVGFHHAGVALVVRIPLVLWAGAANGVDAAIGACRRPQAEPRQGERLLVDGAAPARGSCIDAGGGGLAVLRGSGQRGAGHEQSDEEDTGDMSHLHRESLSCASAISAGLTGMIQGLAASPPCHVALRT
jgi:hypothetical protein